MFISIGDRISVLCVYTNGVCTPKKFLWKGKAYSIQTVTVISDIPDGKMKNRMYSCVAHGTLYRIVFSRDNETWTLEELWSE